MRTHYEISEAPLSLEALAGRLSDPGSGALATFSGTTRNSFRGKEVRHLEYEVYREMADPVLRAIGTEVAQQWPQVTGIAIAHRSGRVDPGETSVIVAVSAPHRAAALAACAWAIDRLKEVLPVWKKEVFADGEEWRENAPGTAGPEPRPGGGEPP